jgi:hypothetical protein
MKGDFVMTNMIRKNTSTEKRGNFREKIAKYLEDNAFWFVSACSMMNGSNYMTFRYNEQEHRNA